MNAETEAYLAKRRKYGARHYKWNENVVVVSAKGIYVYDTEGREYIDAVAGYSSVNLGHTHPRIMEVGRSLYEVDASGRGPVSVVPNAYLTVAQANFLEYACNLLSADRALATNGGAEGVEAAQKLILKWGYTRKKIPKDKARIIYFEGNFHGRTKGVIEGSSERAYKEYFGPYSGSIITIPYDDLSALAYTLEENFNVAGILIEPIQGEGGIRIPKAGYLRSAYRLCRKYNVIFCADEIQTGLGRTGALLASHHENVNPDIFILAKSLGVGKNAVSVVFAKDEFMCFDPGEHGSTYGGNTAAMTLALTELKVLKEEGLCEKSRNLGLYLLNKLRDDLLHISPRKLIADIRGRGLMIGIELSSGVCAEDVIGALLNERVLTESAHGVIRITPPLIITKEECDELVCRIVRTFRKFTQTY